MFFKTKSGKEIELTRNGKIYTAIFEGKVLGEVKQEATVQLGWHLRTKDVALTVDSKDVIAVKKFLAEYVFDLPMSKKDKELKAYYDDHAKVLNANFGSV